MLKSPVIKTMNSAKIIGAVILATVLFGCASQTQVKQPALSASLGSATHKPTAYLAEASNAKLPEKRDRYRLLAAHAYINDGNYVAAEKVLNAMLKDRVQEHTLLAEHIYLSARIAEQIAGHDAALALLDYPPHWQLPQSQKITYHRYKARLYKQANLPIDQVRQLSLLSTFLPSFEAAKVSDTIWNILQPLHEDTVKGFAKDALNPTFAGWLQLAYIAKHYAVDPNQLVLHLGQWQRNNPYHTAAVKLPSDLEKALNAKPFRPKNIAVLLPLSGPRAAVAEPIRLGILSSYQSQFDSKASVNFYDTQLGIEQAYQQAVSAGAEFVIGPLLPEEVEKLQNLNDKGKLLLPQLFLNQTDNFTPKAHQFYFSLSPAQEASDAARKLFQDGINLPLLLVSNDPVGKRMAESFNQAWFGLTQSNAEIHYYNPGDQMKLTVQEALGVKDSVARIDRMKALLGNKLEADFRSRRDIDAIYMVSAAQDLSLLKAFLDVNFSVFAKPVALYTTSRSRLENDSGQAVQELNKLMISDIPWLMRDSSETRMVNELWAQWSYSQKRLYIMGFDALDLVNRLAQMRAFPGFQFNGRSGALSVKPNGVIERQLSWGRYQQGVLTPQ
ncbi:penicillin-binding protein activator [Shewanella denitrificans]